MISLGWITKEGILLPVIHTDVSTRLCLFEFIYKCDPKNTPKLSNGSKSSDLFNQP